jgi:hypothetical protein
VSKSELYNFKMIQNTNKACLETHTHTSRQENTQNFVLNDLGDCCCCASPLDAISFKNGYSTTEELVCSAVTEMESVAAV